MKKLLLTIAAVLGFASMAVAQVPTYSYQQLYHLGSTDSGWGSNYVVAATGTNINAVIDCRHQDKVTMQFIQQYDKSTNTVTTTQLCLARSVDGVNYDTTANQLIAFTPNGSTAAVAYTNLSSVGCGYIKVLWVTNNAQSGSNLTNFTIGYGVKMSSP